MILRRCELLADPTRPEVRELAFTVEGDCQRKGMGSALMKEVIDAGVQAGFERLELEILPDNESMLALARFFERIEARNGRLFASIDLAEDLEVLDVLEADRELQGGPSGAHVVAVR